MTRIATPYTMLRPYSGMFCACRRLTSADEPDGAGDRAEVVAAAAEDGDAADHDRGDRLEEVRVAHAERRLAAVGDEDDPRQSREDAAQHVEDHRHHPHADARQEGGDGVVADRVDAPPEVVAAEDDRDRA